MKPVLICRFSATEGAGYFATFLARNNIPAEMRAIDAGDPVPESVAAYSGLCMMGGPMSVNDSLPWIAPMLSLVCEAVAADQPVLGHCLGGQLLAKALGALVTRAPHKEIGWGKVTVAATPLGQAWFGDIREFESFHWHGETFGIPSGAELILWSELCAHQAYALGKHLGLQCHLEMTEAMVKSWCESGAAEIAASSSPGVQSPERIQANLEERVARLSAVADRVYTRWILGLSHAD
ncbi:MAG: type 1 glutamine amidotransferase [Betaproteobacteria bacterium]|nr:type 1 glutamine amidotransferase [Betaproteobacteria bacterium]